MRDLVRVLTVGSFVSYQMLLLTNKKLALSSLSWFQDFHEEHALQAFRRLDRGNTGFITSLAFYDIMTLLKSHLLTDCVKENLLTVSIMYDFISVNII